MVSGEGAAGACSVLAVDAGGMYGDDAPKEHKGRDYVWYLL